MEVRFARRAERLPEIVRVGTEPVERRTPTGEAVR